MPKGRRQRGNAKDALYRVLVAMEAETGVDWADLLSENRCIPKIAEARVLAMAVSVAVGIQPYLVARMFKRTWQTVDEARADWVARSKVDENDRDKFIRILYQSMK